MEWENDPLRPQVDFVYLKRDWTAPCSSCRAKGLYISEAVQKHVDDIVISHKENVRWMGWTSTGKSLFAQLKSVILLSQTRNLICTQEHKYKNRDKKHKDKREINAPWQQRPPPFHHF